MQDAFCQVPSAWHNIESTDWSKPMLHETFALERYDVLPTSVIEPSFIWPGTPQSRVILIDCVNCN